MKLIPIVLVSIALIFQQLTIEIFRKQRDKAIKQSKDCLKQSKDCLDTAEQVQKTYNVLWEDYTNLSYSVIKHISVCRGTVL